MIGRKMLLVRSWIIPSAVLLGLSLIILFSSSAQTPAEFGPETFVKEGRAPQRHVRTFELASSASPCTLTVENGDQPATRVGRMTLWLNSRPVVRLSERGPSIPSITKTVSLKTRNRLALIMVGKTGALVTVTIRCTADNIPPTADAGADQTVRVGETVVLDGSGSSDADGDSLTFSGSLSQAPEGCLTELSDPGAIQPTLTRDLGGTYIPQLIVNDRAADSASATVTISTESTRPVADAGPNQAAFVGTLVTLEGLGSTDADLDTLTDAWSLIAQPDSSTATLEDADQPLATFLPADSGDYSAQFVVSDGRLESLPDTALISATDPPPPNRSPSITSSPVTAAVVG